MERNSVFPFSARGKHPLVQDIILHHQMVPRATWPGWNGASHDFYWCFNLLGKGLQSVCLVLYWQKSISKKGPSKIHWSLVFVGHHPLAAFKWTKWRCSESQNLPFPSRHLLLDPRDDFFQSFLQRSLALNAQDFLAIVCNKMTEPRWNLELICLLKLQTKYFFITNCHDYFATYYDLLRILWLLSIENSSWILHKFSRSARLYEHEKGPVDAEGILCAASFALVILSFLLWGILQDCSELHTKTS